MTDIEPVNTQEEPDMESKRTVLDAEQIVDQVYDLVEEFKANINSVAQSVRALEKSAPQPKIDFSPEESAFKWAPGEKDRNLFPIRHEDLWDFRKKLEALHWNAQEVDRSKDKKDWLTRMDEGQRTFVKMQLAFFSRIDIDVLENIGENFIKEVDCMEAQAFYAGQEDQEWIHAESYSLQILAVMDGEERDHILNAVRTMPIIAKIRSWVLRWFDTKLDLGERLVAFAAVEGVLFSASFAALQWLRELNLLPGITDYNSFISRDEGIHTLFTCLLVRKYLRAQPSQERAEAIFRSVVDVIDEFVKESLPVRLIGMNDDLMMQYVRFQADSVMEDMGYSPIWRVTNPFRFMDKMALNDVTKVSFFESRPTQYQNVTKEGATRLAFDDDEPSDDE